MDTFLASLTCSRTKHPAVARFAWVEGSWLLTGASRQRPDSVIPASDSQGARQGSFGLGGDYRGCPTCSSDSYVRCGRCAKLGCYDNSWPQFVCPSCGNTGEVTRGIDSVSALDGG